MQEYSAPPPEGRGTPERRGLLSRFGSQKPPATPLSPTLESLMEEYRRAVEERIDDGMRQLQQTAVGLMHEIASEMWRASGSDTSEAQARILNFISRDQAIRGLIAHSDERFQSLIARQNRLEDTVTALAESTRALKEVMQKGSQALHEAASSPALHGVEAVRTQLEQVERHIAAAYEHISERDQALLETITTRVRESGELVTQETGRIVEALQSYVSDGVDSMGRLATHTDEQASEIREQAGTAIAGMQQEAFRAVSGMEEQVLRAVESAQDRMNLAVESVEGTLASAVTEVAEHVQGVQGHDEAIAERITRTLGERVAEIGERIGNALSAHETWMLRTLDASGARFDERLDATATQVEERMESQTTRLRDASILLANELNRTLDARVQGLAQLLRSDSEALRRALVAAAEGHDGTLRRELDERLGQVTLALDAATTGMSEELLRRIGDVRLAIDKNTTQLNETVTGAIDRNMVRMSETLESEIGRVGNAAGQRAAEAADAAVGARLDETLGGARTHLESAATAIERMEEGLSSHIDEARRTAQETSRAAEEEMAKRLDERIGALARMIRSDNRVMVERLQEVAEQEPAKNTLRAVKELQATLTAEVMAAIEQRLGTFTEQIHRDTQAMAENVANVTEKLDKATDAVSKRSDREMQAVIERMGDAMHALASMSKSERIEIE
ncbi:MAG TPA: hypothetical protein VJN50_02220 [Actinomycetota bacterium]|nr:hypothetical protein [Actinomycetota bacterium]